ncbi:MAG: glycosyltransferase family 87 protein [Janthinobacterium lividum]
MIMPLPEIAGPLAGSKLPANTKRAQAYAYTVAATLLLVSVILLARTHNLIDPTGHPLGNDFVTFWSASKLALSGHPADAYSLPLISGAEHLAIPASSNTYAWFYPLPYFLLVLPLAYLPYTLSFVAFEILTLTTFLATYSHLFPKRADRWLMVGYAAIWINFWGGQNGFITATLLGTAVFLPSTRPKLAGFTLGLLVIKPHLALIVVLATVGRRAWKTLFTAFLTGLLSTGTAIWFLGVDTWRASFASLGLARHLLETGLLPWAKMPTMFAFSRLLGLSTTYAYVCHALVMIGACVIVIWVWRRCRDEDLRTSSIFFLNLLISPYLFDYDLVCMAFPLTMLYGLSSQSKWLRGEKTLHLLVSFAPILIEPVARLTSIQLGPFLSIIMLFAVARRVRTLPSTQQCLRELYSA